MRELTPKFLKIEAFLCNQNRFGLGFFDDGAKVDDMQLQQWAHLPVELFHISKLALESPIISSTLSAWVDLISGYKQRGLAVVEEGNDFHPYSYSEIMQMPEADEMKQTFIAHTLNFGGVPLQIFKTESHNTDTRRFGTLL